MLNNVVCGLPMSFYAVSLHIDRPDAAMSLIQGGAHHGYLVRTPIQPDWSQVMKEVTLRTAAPFGSAYLGLHDKNGSHYYDYAAIAHRRGQDDQLIPPKNVADRLFKPGTLTAVDDVLTRWVAAEVVSLKAHQVRADDHLSLRVDEKAYQRMQAEITNAAAFPPLYNVPKHNCMIFNKHVLSVGAVAFPPIPDSVTAGPRRLQTPNHASVVLQAMATAQTPVHGRIAVNAPQLLKDFVP
jgi:hypothetical protein